MLLPQVDRLDSAAPTPWAQSLMQLLHCRASNAALMLFGCSTRCILTGRRTQLGGRLRQLRIFESPQSRHQTHTSSIAESTGFNVSLPANFAATVRASVAVSSP